MRSLSERRLLKNSHHLTRDQGLVRPLSVPILSSSDWEVAWSWASLELMMMGI